MAWAAREGRGWFAHRLELDRPPDGVTALVAALASWDAEGHPPEVARRSVCWETALDAPWVPVPARFAPWCAVGVVRPAQPRAGAPDPRIRAALGSDQLDAIADAQAREHPALGDPHRRELRWLYRGLGARGATTWSAWEGGEPIAAVTTTPGGTEARLRELWTASAHRRRGLGTALIDAAIRAVGGPLIAACETGGEAHRLYLRAGFRDASRFVIASLDRAAPIAGDGYIASRTASPTGPASVT